MDTVGLLKRMAVWAGALKGSEVRVAVVLVGLQLESEDGVARISALDLTQATGLNWSSVDYAVKELKRVGLIEAHTKGYKTGVPASFRLNLDWKPVRQQELMAA